MSKVMALFDIFLLIYLTPLIPFSCEEKGAGVEEITFHIILSTKLLRKSDIFISFCINRLAVLDFQNRSRFTVILIERNKTNFVVL